MKSRRTGGAVDLILKAYNGRIPCLTFHGENSMHLAYLAGDEAGGHVVHDGKPSPAFRFLDWASFSPRRGHWAFAARDVVSSRKGIAVVVGDEIKPMTPETTWVHHVGFTGDGKHIAKRTSETDGVERECLLVDGLPGPEFEEVVAATISPDGARLAYIARSADTDSVVLDGHTGLAFERIPEFLFSPDGRHLAHIAASTTDEGVRMRAVVDGRAGAEFEVINYMVFSPDSQRFAFVALEGKGAVRVVVDGQPSPTVSLLRSLGIARSGALWPMTRNSPKCRRGENLTTGCSHDIPVRFSKDSRSYLYVTFPNGKARVVLDGDLMPAMDEIVAEDLDFDSDGSVSYLAIRDGALFRVRHRRAAVVD